MTKNALIKRRQLKPKISLDKNNFLPLAKCQFIDSCEYYCSFWYFRADCRSHQNGFGTIWTTSLGMQHWTPNFLFHIYIFSGKITPFYRQVFPYFDSDFFSRCRLSYWRYFDCVGQLRVDDSEKRSEVNVLFPLNWEQNTETKRICYEQ